MKGDFSRITFKPASHYDAVLLHQGRVLIDADFNEQSLQVAHAIRRRMRDLLGPHAGRADAAGALGFAVTQVDGHLVIGRGGYYVDGLLVENTAPLSPDGQPAPPLRYIDQPGFLLSGSLPETDLETDTTYFFYLDAWEAPVSWWQDPLMRDVALGGRDTSLRLRAMWQVRAVERPAGNTFDAEAWLRDHVQRHPWTTTGAELLRLPMMKAWTDPKDNSDDTPCVADPLGGYRGLENQLYRVEIHVGTDPAKPTTFKWSRDNGSVVAAWVDNDGGELIVDGVHDTAHGFSGGQWVELTDDTNEQCRLPGVMVRLVKVDRNRLTFDPASTATVPVLTSLVNPIVRRWDHRASKDYAMADGAIVLEEDKDYLLERGLRIRFRKRPANAKAPTYRTGDYWLAPARTATSDLEWPFHIETVPGENVKTYDFVEPDGVHHVYAPLSVVTPTNAPTAKIVSLQRTIIKLWASPT